MTSLGELHNRQRALRAKQHAAAECGSQSRACLPSVPSPAPPRLHDYHAQASQVLRGREDSSLQCSQGSALSARTSSPPGSVKHAPSRLTMAMTSKHETTSRGGGRLQTQALWGGLLVQVPTHMFSSEDTQTDSARGVPCGTSSAHEDHER